MPQSSELPRSRASPVRTIRSETRSGPRGARSLRFRVDRRPYGSRLPRLLAAQMLIVGSHVGSTMPRLARRASSSDGSASAVSPSVSVEEPSAQAASLQAASLQAASLQAALPQAADAQAASLQAASLQAADDHAASLQAALLHAALFHAAFDLAADCHAAALNTDDPSVALAMNWSRPAFGFGSVTLLKVRDFTMSTSPTPSAPLMTPGSGIAVTMRAPLI